MSGTVVRAGGVAIPDVDGGAADRLARRASRTVVRSVSGTPGVPSRTSRLTLSLSRAKAPRQLGREDAGHEPGGVRLRAVTRARVITEEDAGAERARRQPSELQQRLAPREAALVRAVRLPGPSGELPVNLATTQSGSLSHLTRAARISPPPCPPRGHGRGQSLTWPEEPASSAPCPRRPR